ncbi:MAG: hypothetical protein ACKOQS_19510 [Dolichospermum sp.]
MVSGQWLVVFCSLFPVLCSLFPVLCSLFPVPCSLFPVNSYKYSPLPKML